MPLEIRELHIKVNVNQSPGGASNPAQPPAVGGAGKAAEDRDQLLRECIDEVMHVLQNKKER